MIEQDTLRLLRECGSGAKMGISSIDDVLENIENKHFYDLLHDCRDKHIKLNDEIDATLDRFHEDSKEPGVMLKTMSAFKTNLELAVNPTDAAIASLMTDGCNMGVKSLSKYLNEYKAADEHAKDLCKKLIALEDQLIRDIRLYL